MGWDSIDAILPETNKIAIDGDLRDKYREGSGVVIRGTLSSDGIHLIKTVQYIVNKTHLTVTTDLTEDSQETGQIRIHGKRRYIKRRK